MASVYDWSVTAGNNSSADAGIAWPEGMDPGLVNDSARQMMGRIAEILGDLGGALSAGGTANGLTVTANSAFTTLAEGRLISFRATASNSAAATLNVNGIGAKAIRKMDSTGDVAIGANEIRNTGIYVAQYSAALNGAAGGWLLLNPTLSAAIYALQGLVTVDNTVPRFNGIAGAFQTSGVVISDANSVSGILDLTITGNIVSLGLDDNATGERVDITDTVLSLGSSTAASDYIVARPAGANAGSLTLNGNVGGTTGAGVRIYGQSHASNPNTVTLLAAGTEIARSDATGFMIGTTGIISTAASTPGFSVEVNGRMAQVITNNSCLGQRRLGGVGGVIQTYVDGAGSSCGNITTSTGATAFNTSSDGRLKTNLRPIKSGDIIDALEAWKFDWNFADKAAFGVIAQEADKVFHHAVSIDDDGLYSVDYSKFVPVLLAEAKALRARVAALEAH